MPKFAIQLIDNEKIKYACEDLVSFSNDLNDALLSTLFRITDACIPFLKERYPKAIFKIVAVNLVLNEDYIN